MALKILYRGHADSLSTLAASAFTRQNFGAAGMTSTRITAKSPDGVIAGMVAASTSNPYEVTICDDTKYPRGIFINDAVGSPYENTPAVASGKCPFMHSMGSYEVDIYETRNAADDADLVYNEGELLYASANGLLSKEASASGIVIAVVSKAPSSTNPWLGFDLKI